MLEASSLEGIRAGLPLSAHFNTDLDALVNVLCAPLVIDTKLEDVAVLHRERPALRVGRAEPDVVQERAAGRFCVFDKETTAALDPDLSMGPRYDLALEREAVGAHGVDGGETEARAVGEAADAQGRGTSDEIAGDGLKAEGAPGVDVGDEADAMGGGAADGIVVGGGGGGRGGRC